jgi:hypothetical protein
MGMVGGVWPVDAVGAIGAVVWVGFRAGDRVSCENLTDYLGHFALGIDSWVLLALVAHPPCDRFETTSLSINPSALDGLATGDHAAASFQAGESMV